MFLLFMGDAGLTPSTGFRVKRLQRAPTFQGHVVLKVRPERKMELQGSC